MSDGWELGRVHVVTGPGKGKTTSAFGLAMRAAGHGLRVCVIQFMKTGDVTGEAITASRLDGIEVVQFGTGNFIDADRNPTTEDREIARAGLEFARGKLQSDGCSLVVLDEINVIASMGLVGVGEVLEMLRSRRANIEVVLTGRNAPKEFVEFADYVSYIEEIKHPYSNGLKARKGVEW
jgi:cob(I)alamin adenosyltransferase